MKMISLMLAGLMCAGVLLLAAGAGGSGAVMFAG